MIDIWKHVRRHTFSSPERQIALLVEKASKIKGWGNNKILDVGGGLMNRRSELEKLGECITLDIKKYPWVDVVGDAEDLPLEEKSFDIVAAFMILEHLKNPGKALGEFYRVLKPKGLVLLTTVQYWHTHAHPNDYYRFTKEGLKYLFSEADFEIKKIWSMGGPFLVVFHAIELNLPPWFRKFFLLLAPLFNFLDEYFSNHEDKRKLFDSVGWSVLAEK